MGDINSGQSSCLNLEKLGVNQDGDIPGPLINAVCIRATSHLCVKRERPLIITYSLHSENIMHYHFYLKHVRGEE